MKTVESYGTFSTYFCPLYVVSVTFEFLCQLIWQLNENSPYAKHFYRVANKFCYGHSSVRSLLYRNKTYWLPCNYRMTIVKNYLLRYFDHHPQYYTQFAPLRDRNQPRLKSMSKVCNVSSQMSQRKKNRENLTFHLVYPKSESRYPKYCQNCLLKEMVGLRLENLNPAQSSQSLLSQTHRKLQYNNVYTISEKDFRWSTTAFSFSLKSLARFGLCLVALKSLVSQYQRESWDRNFMMISMCVSILWAFG